MPRRDRAVSADTEIGPAGGCALPAAYLQQLSWSEAALTASASASSAAWGDPPRSASATSFAARPGFLLHSVLGRGLRLTSCLRGGSCRTVCEEPRACAYGYLFETRAPASSAPLSGVARIPSPLVLDVPWRKWRFDGELTGRLMLLGVASRFAPAISIGLERACRDGVGPERFVLALAPLRWSQYLLRSRLAREDIARVALGETRITLELLTPLRIVRQSKLLMEFSLVELVRDLNFRVAVWGHYHQQLEWAPRWLSIAQAADQARVVDHDLRWASDVRYSARQQRELPRGGLVGRVEIENVAPDLLLLLRAGEVCGVGKGGSIGFGRIRVTQR